MIFFRLSHSPNSGDVRAEAMEANSPHLGLHRIAALDNSPSGQVGTIPELVNKISGIAGYGNPTRRKNGSQRRH